MFSMCVNMCNLGLHECLTKMCEYMYDGVCVLLRSVRSPSRLMIFMTAVLMKLSRHLLLLLCLHNHSTSSHWRETPPQVVWAGPNCPSCLWSTFLIINHTLLPCKQTDRQSLHMEWIRSTLLLWTRILFIYITIPYITFGWGPHCYSPGRDYHMIQI